MYSTRSVIHFTNIYGEQAPSEEEISKSYEILRDIVAFSADC